MIEYLSNLCNISLLLPEESILTDEEFTELSQLLPKVNIYRVNSQNKSKDQLSINKNIFHFRKYFGVLKNNIKKQLFFVLQRNNLSNIQKKSAIEEFVEMYSLANPYYLHSQKYVEKINEIIVQDEIDIVQLECVVNLNLVNVIPPHVKKIFVEHEGVFYRIESHIKEKKNKIGFC